MPTPDETNAADLTEAELQRLVALDDASQLQAATQSGEVVRQVLQQLRTIYTPEPVSRESGTPEKIGRYLVQRLLGAGGFAVVYLAVDPELQREVAVKIPLPPGLLNADTRKRFILEAQAAAKLDHPHITPAYEAGEDGPIPFIAYAYCSGPTLAMWLKDSGPLAPELAAASLAQLADAVAYSHQRGIVHRDIKPANVLLFPTHRAQDGGLPFIPRLTDFGLAKLMETAASQTGSSLILGTPIYLAPEQLDATEPDNLAVTDIYGLGAVLYEMLTGCPLFSGVSVARILEQVRQGQWQPPLTVNPRLPRDLVVICEKALASQVADRYATAGELRDDLQRYLRGDRIHARSLSGVTLALRSLKAPARIGEATGFLVFSHLAILFWITFWLLGIVMDLPIAQGTTLAELMPYTAPLIVVHGTAVLLGWPLYHGRMWAAALSTLIGAVLTLFVSAVVLRWINPPYPSIYPNERTRDIVFVLLSSLFFLQTLFCSIAWWACYTLRQRRAQ